MIATEAIEVVKWQQGIEFLAGVSCLHLSASPLRAHLLWP